MTRTLLATLLLLPAALTALAPVASACHIGAFSYGPPEYMEVVGVGSNSAGVYVIHQRWVDDESAGSFGCTGQTWAQRCPTLENMYVATLEPIVVPQVRVLGNEVVPETVVLGETDIYAIVADDTCLVQPLHAGAYVNGFELGTDDVLP